MNDNFNDNYKVLKNNSGITFRITFFPADEQCWGKLLLKVMHYDIALLQKRK